MKLNKLIFGIVLSSLLSIAGCNNDVAPGDYDASEVGKIKKVVPGVIVSMRPVRLHNKNADIGIPPADGFKSSGDNVNYPNVNRSHGFEYVIKLNSGSIISVVQAENTKLKVKQHILVIYGRNTRVVADNGSDDF